MSPKYCNFCFREIGEDKCRRHITGATIWRPDNNFFYLNVRSFHFRTYCNIFRREIKLKIALIKLLRFSKRLSGQCNHNGKCTWWSLRRYKLRLRFRIRQTGYVMYIYCLYCKIIRPQCIAVDELRVFV